MAFLFDAGAEGGQPWWGTAALLQYKINKKLQAAARAEYYNDPHSVIIMVFPATGIQVSGYSFNFDFIASIWLSVRTEVKYMNGAADVFDRNGQAEKKNMSLLLSLASGFLIRVIVKRKERPGQMGHSLVAIFSLNSNRHPTLYKYLLWHQTVSA